MYRSSERTTQIYAANKDGTLKPEHTYWKGFANRTAKGLVLERKAAGSN